MQRSAVSSIEAGRAAFETLQMWSANMPVRYMMQSSLTFGSVEGGAAPIQSVAEIVPRAFWYFS